ncbi:MAG: calcium-binding protein [Pseudomonadota bacterium]
MAATFFGGNFLFDRDTVDGTFDAKADALNLNLLRYPGGGIAEDYFRLADPDRRFVEQPGREEVVPLSEFVAYAKQADVEYSIVVPTLNYIADIKQGIMSMDDAVDELRHFIRELNAGTYGDNMPTLLEIGNEYYTMKGVPQSQASEFYAEIAVEFVKLLTEELPLSTKIAIQAGANQGENDIILEHVLAESLASSDPSDLRIDTVIVHSYPWTLDQTYDQHESRGAIIDDWIDPGLAESVYLSEWNTGGPLDNQTRSVTPNDAYERGMAQAATLIEMAAGYLDAGVEYAAVWPIQQNTHSDLSGNEGELGSNQSKLSSSNLTLLGEAYELMSSSLTGSRRLETRNIDLDLADEAARYQDEILVEAFENESEIILFASAWNLNDDQLQTVFNFDLGVRISGAETTVLRSLARDKTDPNGTPFRTSVSHDDVSSTADITHRFEDEYEVVRIIYQKAETGFVSDLPDVQRNGTDSDDYLVGTNRNEAINALLGDDTIIGNGGDDTIFGSRGSDDISGGADNDVIRSAGGSDRINAGSGNDFLAGGGGDDHLSGSSGNDEIRGGTGNDVLKGGRGADKLNGYKGDDQINSGKGEDTVSGGSGKDVIKGGGGDDLIYANSGSDRVNGSGGNDTVLGGQGNDTLNGNAGDDHLRGGAGNDVVRGGKGDDELTGGAGADRFLFKAGDGDNVITDFNDNADVIEFAGRLRFDDLQISAQGGDAVISFEGGSVLLDGVSADVIGQNDFIF